MLGRFRASESRGATGSSDRRDLDAASGGLEGRLGRCTGHWSGRQADFIQHVGCTTRTWGESPGKFCTQERACERGTGLGRTSPGATAANGRSRRHTAAEGQLRLERSMISLQGCPPSEPIGELSLRWRNPVRVEYKLGMLAGNSEAAPAGHEPGNGILDQGIILESSSINADNVISRLAIQDA